MASGSIKNLFSIDFVNIHFSQSCSILDLARAFWYPADISIGGASWTLDPRKEAVNYKVKHTNNKFDV